MNFTFLVFTLCSLFSFNGALENLPIEQKLIERLQNLYEFPVRPVKSPSDKLDLFVRFFLLQITELNLKDQLLTLHVRLNLEWTAYKYNWNPAEFGGVSQVSFPSRQLWQPDLCLYKPNVELDLREKHAIIYSNGLISWKPSVVIKGLCPIKVEYYPFDVQTCTLLFGSWTQGGDLVWLTLADLPKDQQFDVNGANLSQGVNLKEYIPSMEWELVSSPARYFMMYYDHLNITFPYPMIELTLTLRRHAKFYLVYFILPLSALSYLSLLVFYLPADSGEKITLCMSLMTSQITYLLLMIDSIPVTSLAIPLLGKLIIFNMFTIFCSTVCTTIVVNLNYRKPSTHDLPKWVENLRDKKTFLKILMINSETVFGNRVIPDKNAKIDLLKNASNYCEKSFREISGKEGSYIWKRTMANIDYIRNHIERNENENKECQHWKFLAAVVDRIFFILFHIVYISFMTFILWRAPALYYENLSVDTLVK